MKTFFLWALLTSLFGHPLVAVVIVIAFLMITDQITFRILPGPIGWVRRWQRSGQLRAAIAGNPHDRPARLELAGLLVERGRFAEAGEMLAPNAAAGDDDPLTTFMLACAHMGAGPAGVEEGERLFARLEATSPGFRQGELHLARGRFRLAAGRIEEAVADLQAFIKRRPGTVEGRALLVRALRRQGHGAEAGRVADEAWREYAEAPRFRQRIERRWAWSLRPSRPLMYAAIVLGVLSALSLVARP